MFKENIINLPFWTIIKMPINKEYLNPTLGLTLLTPGLVWVLLSVWLLQFLTTEAQSLVPLIWFALSDHDLLQISPNFPAPPTLPRPQTWYLPSLSPNSRPLFSDHSHAGQNFLNILLIIHFSESTPLLTVLSSARRQIIEAVSVGGCDIRH